MSSKCYIYGLAHPHTNEVRYIGKSYEPRKRFVRHLRYARNKETAKDMWICKLLSSNIKPSLVILMECKEEGWQRHEIDLIARHKNLLNLTPGGDGLPKGYRMSQESRAKMSATRTGRKHSAEWRKNISLGLMGKPSPMKGKKFTQQHRDKISKALMGRVFSAESRMKMSIAKKKFLSTLTVKSHA